MYKQLLFKKIGILIVVFLLVYSSTPTFRAIGDEKTQDDPQSTEPIENLNKNSSDAEKDLEVEEIKNNNQKESKKQEELLELEKSKDNVPTKKVEIQNGSFSEAENNLVEKEPKNNEEKPAEKTLKKSLQNEVMSLETSSTPTQYFNYSVNNDNTIKITGYTGSETDIIIPSEIDGKPVTIIGNSAFKEKGLTSVEIPDTVVTIEDEAFMNNLLTSVKLGENLETIGNWAFYSLNNNYNRLESIEFPSKLKTIGNSAFSGNNINSITFSENLETIGNFAFNNNNLQSIEFPSKLKTIGNSAFNNNLLTSIKFGENVETIGSQAFSANKLQGSLKLPSKLKSIGERAFYFNRQLDTVVLGDNIETIGNEAFRENSALNRVIFKGDVKNSIGNGIFRSTTTDVYGPLNSNIGTYVKKYNLNFIDINSLYSINFSQNGGPGKNASTKVTISNLWNNETLKYAWSQSTTTPAENAWTTFQNGDTIEWNQDGEWYLHVYVKENEYDIENYAHSNVFEVDTTVPDYFIYSVNEDNTITITGYYGTETDVIIPSEISRKPVTVIGKGAFREKGLTSVEIPDTVVSIEEEAFKNNYLTSVKLGENVETIGIWSFGSSSKNAYNQLESIELPSNLKTIERNAFTHNNLKNIEFPTSLKTIGNFAFYNNGLTSVSFGKNLEMIDYWAFANNKLKSIELPTKLKTIGDSAFYENQLSEIKFGENVETIGEWAFASNELKNTLVFPSSLKTIKTRAFFYNIGILYVVLGENIETIEEEAFSYTHTLKGVLFKGDVKNSIGNNIFITSDELLTIYGNANSKVETYAEDYNHYFVDINNLYSVNFNPNGSDWVKNAATTVTVPALWDFKELKYAWTQTTTMPAENEWTTFQNGDTIEWNQNGGWYLHVYVKDEYDIEKYTHSNVFKVDNTPPVLTLNGEKIMYVPYGGTFHDPGYTVSDNSDEIITQKVIVEGEVDTSKVGIYEIRYNVEDAAGNTAQEVIREVHVVDDIPPVITLNGAQSLEIGIGTKYEELGATATDNVDGDISNKIEVTGEVDENQLGTYEIRYNVEDSSGNKAQEVVREVQVIDDIPPVITLNGAQSLEIGIGTKYEELGATATDNVDGDISNKIEITGEVDENQLGTYEIHYNVKDEAGNKAQEVVRVVHVVLDEIPPVITLNGAQTLEIGIGTKYKELGATATDNVDGDISNNITITGNVNVDKLGVYEIRYNVEDSSGNKAQEVVREVHVIDDIPPVITLNGAQSLEIGIGTKYEELGATATDNVDGDISNKIEITGEVDENQLGTYEIHYNVKDAAGNKAKEVIREVHVVAPKELVLELDKPEIPVYAGKVVKLKSTNTTIVMPNNLPTGTTLRVESVKLTIDGYQQTGEAYNFIFTYPSGKENYTGNFTLTLGVNDNANNPNIYYFNEKTKSLELIGGKIKDNTITVTVNHFSIYGVFSKITKEETPKTDDNKESKNTDSNDGSSKGNPDENSSNTDSPKDDVDSSNTDSSKDDADQNSSNTDDNSLSADTNNKSSEKQLPKTATNIYNWILIGSLFIVLAFVILASKKRRKKEQL